MVQIIASQGKKAFNSSFAGTFAKFQNSSDGRVDRVSAFEAVDCGLIPSRVKPMTLKLVFTASLLNV